jgi:hypothetical protein
MHFTVTAGSCNCLQNAFLALLLIYITSGIIKDTKETKDIFKTSYSLHSFCDKIGLPLYTKNPTEIESKPTDDFLKAIYDDV